MPTNRDSFDDEIDLREVILTLLRYKWWIIGVTVVMAVAGFAVTKLLLPKQYQAVALVAVTKPVLAANLDPNIQTTSQQPDTKTLVDLTRADDLVLELYQFPQVNALLPENMTLDSLKGRLKATAVGVSYLRLEVTDSDPVRAAQIANVWAEKVAARLNNLYDVNQSSLAQLEAQAETARQNWDAAEQALLGYLQTGRVDFLEVSLAQARESLKAYLDDIRMLDMLISDAQVFDARLSAQDEGQTLTGEDAVGLIALAQRATGGLGGLQIQVAGPDILGEAYTVADARAALKTFIASLQPQRDENQAKVDELSEQIAALAAELEAEKYLKAQLTVQRDLAFNTYQALSSEVEGTRIVLAQNNQVAKVAGQALPPEQPSGPRASLNGALAGGVGLVATVMVSLVAHWWRSPTQPGGQAQPKTGESQ